MSTDSRDLSRRVDNVEGDVRDLRGTLAGTREIALETQNNVRHIREDLDEERHEAQEFREEVREDLSERVGGKKLGESWRLRIGVIGGIILVLFAAVGAVATIIGLS